MTSTTRLFVGGSHWDGYIPPVTYDRFSHPELGPLLPNPIPDTVCCVPLLSRQAGPRSAPAATSANALPVASPHPGPSLLQSDTAAGSVQIVPPCVSCPSPCPFWLTRMRVGRSIAQVEPNQTARLWPDESDLPARVVNSMAVRFIGEDTALFGGFWLAACGLFNTRTGRKDNTALT
jgi:hypothetical protein